MDVSMNKLKLSFNDNLTDFSFLHNIGLWRHKGLFIITD